jgi:hypothetical protein
MRGKKTNLILQRAIRTSDDMSKYGNLTWKDVKTYSGVLTISKTAGSGDTGKFSSSNQYTYRVDYDPYVEITFSDRFFSEKTQIDYDIIGIENMAEQDKVLFITLIEG